VSRPTYSVGEQHTESLRVTCPICRRQTKLTVGQRNARRFVGEWCDGIAWARHQVVQMLGPAGKPNR
jgi:hypothetical protein